MKYSKSIKALSLSLAFCTLLGTTPTYTAGSTLLQKVKSFFTAKNQADRLIRFKNITISKKALGQMGIASIVTGIVFLAVAAFLTKRSSNNFRGGAQALINAAKLGDINTAKDLIDNKGVAIDGYVYCDNRTYPTSIYINNLNALHVAARKGHLKFAKMLLRKGANIDAKWHTEDSIDRNQKTALLAALENRHEDIAEMLIKKGANVNIAVNNSLETPLHIAAKMGYTHIVKLLLDNGANIKATTTRRHETPLHKATAAGNTNIAKILIKRGANIEAKTYDSETALHLAVRNGDTKTVKMLLESGANIEARDRDNKTPLIGSCTKKYCRSNNVIVKILVKNGANIGARDRLRKTALDYAKISPNIDTLGVRTLLNQCQTNHDKLTKLMRKKDRASHLDEIIQLIKDNNTSDFDKQNAVAKLYKNKDVTEFEDIRELVQTIKFSYRFFKNKNFEDLCDFATYHKLKDRLKRTTERSAQMYCKEKERVAGIKDAFGIAERLDFVKDIKQKTENAKVKLQDRTIKLPKFFL